MENLAVVIPNNAANLQLPDPMLRDYYRDEEQRIYWVDGEIDSSLLDLVKMIMHCNKEDKDKPVEERMPIKVFIDSPGGDVQALYTTIKAIEISKTPVYTINYCGAYSAAAILLTAGHKRFALPGTSAMFHRGSCYYGGEQSVVESMKKYFDALDKKVDDCILEMFSDFKRLENTPVKFTCDCSKEKFENGLKSLKKEELQKILEEDKQIEVMCNFCSEKYLFNEDEIKKIIEK